VEEAGESWLKAAAANGLERSTINNYREELGYHITPFIGRLKLSEVSPQVVRRLEDTLREQGRSAAMVRRVIGSVGALLADAQEQGLTAHNAVRDLRRNRHRGKERNAERRQKGKLKIGVDIPAPDEIRAIIDHAKGRWRPLLITAIFTGLRASELRGLRWQDVDFNANETASEPIASSKLGDPSLMPGSGRFPLVSLSPTLSRNGSSPVRRASLISYSPVAAAGLKTCQTSSVAVCTLPRWPVVSPLRRSPNIPECTVCDISMPHGASTGSRMAAWGYRPSWCKSD
jgi:hypothetical protein